MDEKPNNEKIEKLKSTVRRLREVTGRLRKPEKLSKSIRKNPEPRPAKSQPGIEHSGVGTELALILAELGIEPKAECSCKSLAGKLDRNGISWCESHADEIVAGMQQNYAAYDWRDKLSAGLKSLPQILRGKLNPLDPLHSLVLLSIERAKPSPYWAPRIGFDYWKEAIRLALKYSPRPQGSLLDVGGGVTMGVRYLASPELAGWQKTAVETKWGDYRMPGVELHLGDFIEWDSGDQRFDVALCLQVLEHVSDPTAFAQKLFELADVVVISVPYKWPKGMTKGHTHDPVDEVKLRKWTGREPFESRIVDRPDRFAAAYTSH